MAMVLGESLLIAVLGGLIGLALGTVFVQGAAAALSQFFPGLTMSVGTFGWGVVLAVLLGLVTGAVPAWRAARLRVVDALGRR
jgi:putative ABC transport system permease protein